LAAHILDEFRRISRKMPPDLDEEEVSLTPREKEVLSHVAIGETDKEIAETLSISIYTVKSHIRNILSKLQVENRRQAAYLAKDKGWV
jgi:DNA-binding NarL/FixJ family response regulator